MPVWSPQPGPQVFAAVCPADFPFFGGSRGGGKTDCLLGRQIYGADKYQADWNGLVIRRKYKAFREIRRRIDGLIRAGMPAIRIGGDNQINFIKFKNGAAVTLAAIQQASMADDFQGHQYTEIAIEEATTLPWFLQTVDKLKGCLRSPAGVPCRMFGTGNPGGPAHQQVKQYFRLGSEYKQQPNVPFEADGETRVYIPSFLKDNKILCEKDPKYVKRLLSISDPVLRKAWIEGDWDIFIGQAFNLSPATHGIKTMPVPKGAPIYFTFDWGFGKPFSCGWWWADADGRLYRFKEWYGWNGTPDEGVRMTDGEIGRRILSIEREQQKWGIIPKDFDLDTIDHILSPDCFNKKPDYKGGGQGKSTAETFLGCGIKRVRPGDPSRALKIRQVRERLTIPEDGSLPMLVAYSKPCRHFFRTMMSLCMDEDNPEDVDTDMEDHVYDEVALMCMARPLKLKEPAPTEGLPLFISHDGSLQDVATKDLEDTKKELEESQELIILDDDEFIPFDKFEEIM